MKSACTIKVNSVVFHVKCYWKILFYPSNCHKSFDGSSNQSISFNTSTNTSPRYTFSKNHISKFDSHAPKHLTHRIRKYTGLLDNETQHFYFNLYVLHQRMRKCTTQIKSKENKMDNGKIVIEKLIFKV